MEILLGFIFFIALTIFSYHKDYPEFLILGIIIILLYLYAFIFKILESIFYIRSFFLSFIILILFIIIFYYLYLKYKENKKLEDEKEEKRQIEEIKKRINNEINFFKEIFFNENPISFFNENLFINFCSKYKSYFYNIDDIIEKVINNDKMIQYNFLLKTDIKKFIYYYLNSKIENEQINLIIKLKKILDLPYYIDSEMFKKYILIKIMRDEFYLFKNKFQINKEENIIIEYCKYYHNNYNFSHVLYIFLLIYGIDSDINFSQIINKIKAQQEKNNLKDFKKELQSTINHNLTFFHSIDQMNGIEFESLIGQIYKKLGYNVTLTKKTGDQGVDIIAENPFEKIAIQAKRSNYQINNKAVQEVVAGKNYYKCTKGIVITNSYFTTSANDLAAKNNIQLINRNGLKKLLETSNLY